MVVVVWQIAPASSEKSELLARAFQFAIRINSRIESNRIETFLPELECSTRRTYLCYRAHISAFRGLLQTIYQWRNDGVAAASNDGGPTAGRGSPTVLEFLVINFSVCLVLLSNCYIGLIIY